jgi:hypothetical protein
MNGINLDLLRASAAHHPDGQPKDPHAHHRAEHLASLRTERRARWMATLARILAGMRRARLHQTRTRPAP